MDWRRGFVQGKEAAGIILFSTPTIKCSYAVPVGKTLWTEVIIPSQWSKPINGVRPPEHRQTHLLQKAGACRAHSGPLVDNSRRMLRPSGGFSIYLCLPQRSSGFSILQPHSPCLDSEGLSIDPFGFTAVTQGAWEAQPLSVRQGANEVTSAEASDSLWRTDCSHLQTTPEGRQPMCGCHPVPGHCFLTTWKSRLGLRPGTSPTPWRQAAANGSPHKLVH